MKESYGEDRASHTDPESCTVVRKGGREALTGAWAGGLLRREIIPVRGADAVSVSGRPYRMRRQGKTVGGPRAGGEPRHAQKHRTREPGDPVFARHLWRDGPHWAG